MNKNIKVIEEGKRKKIYRGDSKKPEGIVEHLGGSNWRWVNARGIDTEGKELKTPPEMSTGLAKTEYEAFAHLGFRLCTPSRKDTA